MPLADQNNPHMAAQPDPLPWTCADHRYMARALALARHGLCSTRPNPRVGCVLVRAGMVVGEGWHRRAGEPHAEVLALTAAGPLARGATCYVTLEPCCHQGRTPPCVEALIAAGVVRVVAAMMDPDPRVGGGGLRRLQQAGLHVQTGLLETQARDLNRGFTKRIQAGHPFVVCKVAASLDGRVALASGESKWISSPAARADVQRLRAQSSAVMTGIGTLLVDDPALNLRSPLAERAPQPLRVILDSRLRTPATARVMRGPGHVLIFTLASGSEKADLLRGLGAEIIEAPAEGPRLDLVAVLKTLAHREVNEVLVEAGPALTGALLAARLVDEVICYLAPKLMGGAALPFAWLPNIDSMNNCVDLTITEVHAVGRDWRVTARVS